MKSNDNMSRKLIVYIILVIAIIFFGTIGYELITYRQPNFFPLDNSQAEYKITKKCPIGQGWTEDITKQDYAYCVEYKGNNVFGDDNKSNFFRITIGNSKIDLEQYLNQQVKNIKGNFVSSTKQCILNNCINISGSHVVLDINSLEAME